ncbi:MAG: hypothetical protein IJW82_07035 [Clostridia bacterium]|nr:hypothetical protein [Clostridia bacterium]
MRNSYLKVFLIFGLIVIIGYLGIYCKGNLNIFNRNEEIGKVEAQLTQLEVDLNTSSGKLLKAITEQSNTINTVQTKINLLSTKQTELEDLTTSISEKETLVKDMDSTTEEYTTLVEEITTLKVKQETLSSEIDTLSNEINILLESDEDLKLYDSLNDLVEEYKNDLEKLKASYIHLKEMLSVDVENGETNYKLNNVKINIEKLEKKISLIDMQLGNMASNYSVIKAIDSRLKSEEENNKHLIFFNIDINDNALETYFKDPIAHAASLTAAVKENINIALMGEDNNIGQSSKTLSLVVPTSAPMPMITSCLVLEDIDMLTDTYLQIKFWTKIRSTNTAASSTFVASEKFGENYTTELGQMTQAGTTNTSSNASYHVDLLKLHFNNDTINDICMININVDFDSTLNQVTFTLDCEGYDIV